MQVVFACPRCERTVRTEIDEATGAVDCPTCEWGHSFGADEFRDGRPVNCLVCGCPDLWRQKDFPPKVGLTMVGLGILFSTLAWWDMRPMLAISILMAFALIDLLLYALMPDVLVCYRCGGRHRRTQPIAEHPRFDLELAERYRQESLRLEDARRGRS